MEIKVKKQKYNCFQLDKGENQGNYDDNFQEQNSKNQIVEFSPKERFYRFDQQIGYGSYKSVFRAYDTDTGRQVAWNIIKLIRLPTQERKRIMQEIAILKNIHHPKIINFINAWINKSKNQMIFITEMVCGGSLKKHLKKIKKPRLKIIKGWCKQILGGLNYLHSIKPNPIIHRDIKCENIFINSNTNQIRIGDLGLAIATKNSYAQTLIGTPEFMAPQILQGKYSTGVDIYAFGMAILQMVTHQIPYKQCKNIHQIYKNIAERIKPKCLQLIQSQQLKRFISKCLMEQVQRPTAAQLLLDLFFHQREQDNKQIKLKQGIGMQVCESIGQNSMDMFKDISKNQINQQKIRYQKSYFGEKQILNNYIFHEKCINLEKEFEGNWKKQIKKDFINHLKIMKQKYNQAIINNWISIKDFYQILSNSIKQEQMRQLREYKKQKKQSQQKLRKQSSVQPINRKKNNTNSSRSSQLSKKKKIINQQKRQKNNLKYKILHLQPHDASQNQQSLQTKSFKQKNTCDLLKNNTKNKLNLKNKDQFLLISPKNSKFFQFKHNKNSQKNNDFKTQTKIKGNNQNLEDNQFKKQINTFQQLKTQYLINQSTSNFMTNQKTQSQQVKNKISSDFQLMNTSISSKNQSPINNQLKNKNQINYLIQSSSTNKAQLIKLNNKKKIQVQQSSSHQFNQEINFLAKVKKQIPKFPVTKQSTKQEIIMIQSILGHIIQQKIEVVGVYGFYTQQMVKKMQKKWNLKIDGYIDNKMYGMMIAQLEKKIKKIEKDKQFKQKSDQQSRIKRIEKNQESTKLLNQLENQILSNQKTN